MENSLENILIKNAKNGDSAAFSRLMKIYKTRLYGYLWNLCRNKELANEIMQETLIKTWKGLPNYNEQNKFSSWLFSIAHNASLDNFRKRKVSENIINTDQIPEQSNLVTQQNFIEADEMKKQISITIENLPEKQREVFLLRQQGELTFKEIAEATNQPLNTVLSHMNYAVKKLKKALREENVI